MRRLWVRVGMRVVIALTVAVIAFSLIAMLRPAWLQAAEPVVCPDGRTLELRNASPVPSELVLEARCMGSTDARDVAAKFIATVMGAFIVPVALLSALIVWIKGQGKVMALPPPTGVASRDAPGCFGPSRGPG